VKGHVGISGDEHADELSKIGRSQAMDAAGFADPVRTIWTANIGRSWGRVISFPVDKYLAFVKSCEESFSRSFRLNLSLFGGQQRLFGCIEGLALLYGWPLLRHVLYGLLGAGNGQSLTSLSSFDRNRLIPQLAYHEMGPLPAERAARGIVPGRVE
jgi:hypothetical protein